MNAKKTDTAPEAPPLPRRSSSYAHPWLPQGVKVRSSGGAIHVQGIPKRLNPKVARALIVTLETAVAELQGGVIARSLPSGPPASLPAVAQSPPESPAESPAAPPGTIARRFDETLDSFIEKKRRQGLSPATLRIYRDQLGRWLAFVGDEDEPAKLVPYLEQFNNPHTKCLSTNNILAGRGLGLG